MHISQTKVSKIKPVQNNFTNFCITILLHYYNCKIFLPFSKIKTTTNQSYTGG